MPDKNAMGTAFLGPPGTGKTNLAKAVGNEGGLPTVSLDFSGMQSSLIGSSEENLRTALKTIEAVCPNPLVIGSMNQIEGLSSAIRRRFNLGVFFFDLHHSMSSSFLLLLPPTDSTHSAIQQPNTSLPFGVEAWVRRTVRTQNS
jgi:AAA+ superfamily predicted ATPase